MYLKIDLFKICRGILKTVGSLRSLKFIPRLGMNYNVASCPGGADVLLVGSCHRNWR